MQTKTKEFLQKLAALMQEYEVDFEITESCHGYGGFSVDGLDIGVKYMSEEYGHVLHDYVTLHGKYHEANDILELIEEDEK